MNHLVQTIAGALYGDYSILFIGLTAIIALCPKPWMVLVSMPVLVALNIAIVLLQHQMRMTWHEFEADKLVSCVVALFAAILLGMILRIVFRGPERMRRLKLQ